MSTSVAANALDLFGRAFGYVLDNSAEQTTAALEQAADDASEFIDESTLSPEELEKIAGDASDDVRDGIDSGLTNVGDALGDAIETAATTAATAFVIVGGLAVLGFTTAAIVRSRK